jgi:group II intron reverse transcriptase/maturase
MIEKIINRRNMLTACQQVVSNKGSAGVDGMTVDELHSFLKLNRDQLATSIINGKYTAQPILGVEIPKSNGKMRLLGIPTVRDRMLQQAVCQVIEVKFETEFKESSFGFRPNRNAQQAVMLAQQYINEGYSRTCGIDIDLKSFFDEVDHSLLLQLLYRKVKCPITLRLIKLWLRAPIMINGVLTKRRKGVPQRAER